MFGFFMAIVTIIQKATSSIKTRTDKIKLKREKYKRMVLGEDSEEEINNASNVKTESFKEKMKTRTLSFLTAVIVFFETLPIFLTVILIALILICIIAVVVVIFAIMSATKVVDDEGVDDFKYNEKETQGVQTGNSCLNWTEAELASNAGVLSDYEKNLYRLGMLSKDALEGYGGPKYLNTGDSDLNITMLLGISSTETGMNFYNGGKNHDITKIPSDKSLNSSGYGFMGLKGSLKVSNQFNSVVLENIAKKYKPQGAYSYDAQFAPWASLLAAQHLDGKRSIVDRGVKGGKIESILNEWGIKANQAEAKALIIHFLLQAQYHGAVIKEYDAYINFWAALFHATSENDSDRTWSKWTIVANESTSYGEPELRTSIVGSSGKNGMHGKSPSALQLKSSATKLALNGVELKQPLWSFIMEKYGSKKGVQLAWDTVTSFSARGSGGVGDRVLNFHYGLNSYLQGERVKKTIAKKIVCSPSGFKETPGKGQATVNGMSTDEYIDKWLANKSSSMKSYMAKLRETWGTSSFLSNKNSPARKVNYVDSLYGVPFYGQGKRFGEKYGEIGWYPGEDSYNESGCMVYSHAYAASALTGKLINASEMGALLITTGDLSGAGLTRGSISGLYKSMGLNSEVYGDTIASWDKIVKKLESGALVVVRGHKGYFTSGYNHFITLNGIQKKDGKNYYSFYTSYEPDKSMTLIEESKLKKELWIQAVAVWK